MGGGGIQITRLSHYDFVLIRQRTYKSSRSAYWYVDANGQEAPYNNLLINKKWFRKRKNNAKLKSKHKLKNGGLL